MYNNGVFINFKKSDLSIIQASVNYLTVTSNCINFYLFFKYIAAYPNAFYTESTNNSSNTTENYLPNPLKKPPDKPRLNYVFQKIKYCFNLAALLLLMMAEETEGTSEKRQKEILILKKILEDENPAGYILASKHIKFWIPRILCGRVRVYEVLTYLFSGAEFERSLILSSKMEILDQNTLPIIINLMVTLFGNSPENPNLDITKVSWNEKMFIFIKHREFYLDYRQYANAKKPFLYTALMDSLATCEYWDCWDWYTLQKKDSKSIPISQLLMSLDNTASGFQLLSLVTGSPNQSLNLRAQTINDEIEDPYSTVKNITCQILKNQEPPIPVLISDEFKEFIKSEQELFTIIQNFLSRKFIKTIMMPYFYGISVSTLFKLVLKFLKEIEEEVNSKSLKELFEARSKVGGKKKERQSPI
jgi:hypothetical protein